MRIDESVSVAHPPAIVWRYVRQVPLVAACLPGAELLEHDESGRFKGRFSIRLGPIAAAFDGEGTAEWNDEARSGTVRGQGRDGRSASRVRAELGFRLAPAADGQATAIAVAVDYTLTGSLAQFGRTGIVTDVARRLTQDFARAFEARINAELAPAGAGPSSPPPEPAQPAAIDAGGLVVSVVWTRIAAWFRRLFGRG